MPNISQIKRKQMLNFLETLKKEHTDDKSILMFNEIENFLIEKKYGLVWEEHSEEVDEMLAENIPVLTADPKRRLCKDDTLPWNFIIEGDNLQALYLLEKTHKGKVDCIYIDPPYNKGNKDWKYNNDYVDENDTYRHSKWLSMMKTRLVIARRLLNPKDSVLIVTVDEKEYAHLGCLLEELFPPPSARIQMVSSLISPQGNQRKNQFSRLDEYIYFVEIGTAFVQKLALSDEWRINSEDKRTTHLHWQQLIRNGNNGTRRRSPNCFYPIYVSKNGKKFMGAGEPLPLELSRTEAIVPEDVIAIWPIHKKDGSEGCWALSRENLLIAQKKGYVKLGKLQKDLTMYITYLQDGMIQKVENGDFEIEGYAEDGSIISSSEVRSFVPGTQWRISSHDASRHGNELLKDILTTKLFDYPKSLYAVYDTIRFFTKSKPNALILDFFAGSGTTQHAVCLLNKEDSGNRRCIMVTNNEISATEENAFRQRYPECLDDENKLIKEHELFVEYQELNGIATKITWPRIACSINGVDVKGKALDGNYGVTKDDYKKNEQDGHRRCYKKVSIQLYPELSDFKKSDGFLTNVKFLRCGWTPRKPEEYLLGNVLCMHVKEMIELQNAIEIDNVKHVLILNKDDYKKTVLDPNIYSQVEDIWVNQNIVFNAQELNLLQKKGFKYIPKEFFGQELREAAE